MEHKYLILFRYPEGTDGHVFRSDSSEKEVVQAEFEEWRGEEFVVFDVIYLGTELIQKP